MLKQWFCIWCVLLVTLTNWCTRANKGNNDLFRVLILFDQTVCVNEETVENIRIDAENLPVSFRTMRLQSVQSDSAILGALSEISAMDIRQKVDELEMDAGLWFSCHDGVVYLTANVDNVWLDQHRALEKENDQLNAEEISAVVHGWLDALIPRWQQETATDKQMSTADTESELKDFSKTSLLKSKNQETADAPDGLSESSSDDRTNDVAPVRNNPSPRTPQYNATRRISLEIDAMGVIDRQSTYSAGGALFIGIRPRRGPLEVYVKGAVLRPTYFRDTSLQLKVRPYPLGVGMRWSMAFRAGTLEAGGELEGIILQYSVRVDAVTINDGISFQLSAAPMVGITFRVFPRGYIAFRLGMRVVLGRPVFEARENGELLRLFATPALQPLGYVGLGFEFL